MSAAFEARVISKTFRRWWSRETVRALDELSLSGECGSIFGLLGERGGKTTLVKIALTYRAARQR